MAARFPIKLVLYGLIATFLAFGACCYSIVHFASTSMSSWRRNNILAKYEKNARKHIDVMKKIGDEIPRFPEVPSDRELRLPEKLRLSEFVPYDLKADAPLPDYNAVIISETGLELLAEDAPAKEERDGDTKWVARIANNYYDEYWITTVSDNVLQILKDRMGSSPRSIEIMLHVVAEADYFVVIRTKTLKTPRTHEPEISGDLLVYDLNTGEYLGAASFHAVGSDDLDYSFPANMNDVVSNDYISQARKAIVAALDERISRP